jgi:hypothetical protein
MANARRSGSDRGNADAEGQPPADDTHGGGTGNGPRNETLLLSHRTLSSA